MKRAIDEPVQLECRRYGYLPEVFFWRGQRHNIRRIESIWTVAQGGGASRLERRYFRVRCDGGTFELYHDLLANTWGVRLPHRPKAGLIARRWQPLARVTGLTG